MNEMKASRLAPWCGSKTTLAPRIVELLASHRAYIEPFCGSMAVLLAKPPCSFELANDLHGDLTNLAWTVQHDRFGPALYRRLRRTLFVEDLFHHVKAHWETLHLAESPASVCAESAERAYQWFIICWMGRSGTLGTVAGNTTFSVRYTNRGGNQAGRFAGAVDSIPLWRRRLRRVTILRRDGLTLLERLADEPNQAVYVDPPYFDKSVKYEHDFSASDHQHLAAILRRFARTRVVLSYYAVPELASLYPGWTQIDCSRAKHLSVQGRRGSTSKIAPEVLLVNQPVERNGDANGLSRLSQA